MPDNKPRTLTEEQREAAQHLRALLTVFGMGIHPSYFGGLVNVALQKLDALVEGFEEE